MVGLVAGILRDTVTGGDSIAGKRVTGQWFGEIVAEGWFLSSQCVAASPLELFVSVDVRCACRPTVSLL